MTERPDLDAHENWWLANSPEDIVAQNVLKIIAYARIQESKIEHAYKEIRALEAERDELRQQLAADGLREFGKTQP